MECGQAGAIIPSAPVLAKGSSFEPGVASFIGEFLYLIFSEVFN